MSTATVNLVELAATWRSARRVYPIYSALNQQFAYGVGPCRELDSPIDRSDPSTVQRVQDWLREVDALAEVHQLRQLLQTSHIASEEGLRALLKLQLAKPEKNHTVRDKVDYLLVQYYAHCAPHDAHKTRIDHDHVSEVLQPVLGDVSPLVPDFCQELDAILQELGRCACLGDLLERKIIDRARTMKDQAGNDYFLPSVLVAYARFNFLLRRGFFRLMHADLHAVRFALHGMESRGQHDCDCSSAGLSERQSFAELREICHDWKKPFRAAYSLGNTFSQLVAIRAAVEAALASPPPAITAASSSPATEADAVPEVQAPAEKPPEAAPVSAIVNLQESAIDRCIEQIGKALASETTKSASVCNFTLAGTNLILASWETLAFLKPSTNAASVLQRAVASRVLLIIAVEAHKRHESADVTGAISQARVEVARLQEEIAAAKDKKDIDSAVNLSATAKRLLGLLEQAGKGK